MASNLSRTAHEEHLALVARLTDLMFIRHQSGLQANEPITNTSIVVRASGAAITYVPLNINDALVRSEFQNLILRMVVSILSSYE
jgi:hypothetical protein